MHMHLELHKTGKIRVAMAHSVAQASSIPSEPGAQYETTVHCILTKYGLQLDANVYIFASPDWPVAKGA